MTDGRKPPGVSWESWIERSIREGIERGEFDGLGGAGEPIADIDRRRTDGWFAERLAQREQVVDLPPALAVRKELQDAREQIAAATSEDEVRHIASAINARIRYVNSHTVIGPPSTVMPLDVEATVEHWSAERQRR